MTTMQYFIDSVLYSYAQIFFSSRKWFGLAILLSTLVMPVIGLMGLVGVLISNLTAIYLKFDKDKIREGFYGFNGILFGSASAYYLELTITAILLTLIFIIITYFVAAVLENHLAVVFNLPGLSLPFVLTLYIFFIFITNFESIFYREIDFSQFEFLSGIPYLVDIFLKSISIILLQLNIITGLIITLAILFYSRVMFLNSIIAFLINYAILLLMFPNFSEIQLTLTSLNAIVTSLALGGVLIILSKKTLPLLVFSTLMVIIFTGFFDKFLDVFSLPVLVLPFNVVVLSIIYSLKFRQEQSDMVLLYFKPGNPEENYYYHQNSKSRFERFRYLFPELPFFGEWTVSQGIEGGITHKENWKNAWDFVIEENEQEYSGNGEKLTEYYCYNVPVAAALEGEVARVIDNVQDNEIGEVNLKQNWGNTVIIKHDDELYSSLCHLKPNSIKVKVGDIVKKGSIIGNCGNSGRSPYPHLHFQFQKTDKLGDKTEKFPIAHFIEKKNDEFEVKAADYPIEKTVVSNIETHKALKNAFKFQLGDEFEVSAKLNGKEFSEKWEVKVDIQNNVYIEEDLGAKAYIYPVEKVFYMTNFIGKRNTALYYFYMLAAQVPLGYKENLSWRDEYPVSILMNNLYRYISEFFLLFKQQLEAYANFGFEERTESNDDFVIKSEIHKKGSGLFFFYHSKGRGRVIIDNEGYLKDYYFSENKNEFSGEIKAL